MKSVHNQISTAAPSQREGGEGYEEYNEKGNEVGDEEDDEEDNGKDDWENDGKDDGKTTGKTMGRPTGKTIGKPTLRVGDVGMVVFPSTLPLKALQSGPSQAPNRAVGLNDRPRVVVL